MKHSLLFALFTCFAFFSSAQIDITVSGEVTDLGGSSVSDVEIIINADSLTTWVGYYNTVYTASDGSYSDTFEVPENLTQGSVWISMVNCDGSLLSVQAFWSPADMPTADFVYCDLQVSCGVNILVDSTGSGTQWALTALPYGVGPYTYAWSTGELTQTIVISDPTQYCVTITDANGCNASECINLGPPPCSVQIQHTPAGALVAVANGDAPFSYAWNTGETTESIFPPAPGTYCVTITANDGCQATDCTIVQGGVDSCGVFIYETQDGSLIAAPNGSGNFTFSWNTGELTPYINPSAPGTYCVTMTDGSGCSASDCYTYESPEPDNYSISGVIFPEDSTSNFIPFQGWVYLYSIDPSMASPELVDSVEIDLTAFGNWYSFDTVGAGTYIVKAVLDPSTPEAEDYFPTYHLNTIWWDQANMITVPYSGFAHYDIVMVQTDGLTGPGDISGFVTDGNGFTSGEIDDRSEDPMAGVTVILTDESDHPLLYDITGEDGTFQFNNLPWGTYKVYLDIVGHDPVFTMVTIGPDQPSVDNIHFEVSSEGITGAEGITSSDQIWLAPNPAKDMVQLNFTLTASSPLSIQLFDLSGKLILSKEYTLPEGEQQISLNLTSLEPGIYFIKTRDKGRIWAQKLIKQ